MGKVINYIIPILSCVFKEKEKNFYKKKCFNSGRIITIGKCIGNNGEGKVLGTTENFCSFKVPGLLTFRQLYNIDTVQYRV